MIPKNIWQTHEMPYSQIDENIKKHPVAWQEMNPNWKYHYMDSEERKAFVLEEFGQEWYDIFNNLPFNVMRSIIWKYMILYRYGGVYIDLDLHPRQPLDKYLNSDYTMIVNADNSDKNDFLFCINFIASTPNNLILKSVIDHIKELLQKEENQNLDWSNKYYLFKLTAEIAFTEGIKKIIDPDNIIGNVDSYEEYNMLHPAKQYGFYCVDLETFYDKLVINMDGRYNWDIGVLDWEEDVKSFWTRRKENE